MNRTGRSMISGALACAALCAGATRFAGATGRAYHNEAMRIAEFEVPRGWTVAPQISWPRLLLIASLDEERGVRRGEAPKETGASETRILLGAQRVVPGATSLGIAADARAQLLKQGFGDVRVEPAGSGVAGEERVRLEATAPRRGGGPTKLLRQIYAVDGDVAVVLTLIAARDKQGRAVRDFDLAAESLVLTLGTGARPPAVDGDTGSPAPDGGAP